MITLIQIILLLLAISILFAVGLFLIPSTRLKYLSKPLLKFVQNNLPPMSHTEREAIEAGSVWWEGNIMTSKLDWASFFKDKSATLSEEEQSFLDNEVETLCGMIDQWKINHEDLEMSPEIWEFLKTKKFFAMAIDKKHGGLEFSALAHSCVIAKIASKDVSVAVNAMVPNSLGPAELLHRYGTQEQRDYYLPRLATGDEIPCFALTGLLAGSDAGSIPDRGVVCKGMFHDKEVLGIRLTWNKRYITLAPKATLLGLAFKLYDPDHLIGDQDELGITCCLIPANHPGVEIGKRHYPMNLGFLNGPTQGDNVFVPIDWIIGGLDMAGHGWRMLMECLSIGRAISLPALSYANTSLCYATTGSYARVRTQFNLPIGKFEGVQEAMAQIAGLHYITSAMRLYTALAVDSGEQPGIASAMAKYHTTEMARSVLNHAMDIHGGRAIQIGRRNYLEQPYHGVPVGITVEGANILTRNLIIFGQGVIRCHPFIQDEMAVVQEPDEVKRLEKFDAILKKHILYSARVTLKSFALGLSHGWLSGSPVRGEMAKYYKHINRFSAALAMCADFAMLLLGGALKRKERLSARLGDVLSYLYQASCVLKYYESSPKSDEDQAHTHWACQYCLYKAQYALDAFLANFPNRWVAGMLRVFSFPLGKRFKLPSDKLDHQLANMMMNVSAFRNKHTKILYKGEGHNEALMRMERALSMADELAPVTAKFIKAIKDGKIMKNADLDVQLQAAVSADILTQAEVQQYQAYHLAMLDAIAVDDFTLEELVRNKPDVRQRESLNT